MVQPITTKVLQSSNSGGGYIWALVMTHILHLVFGLIYLVVNGIRVFTGVIHQGDTVRLKALGIYWHFLGTALGVPLRLLVLPALNRQPGLPLPVVNTSCDLAHIEGHLSCRGFPYFRTTISTMAGNTKTIPY